jgi:hypothetical protein
VIEASGEEVSWMEPRDLSVDEAIELMTTKPRSGHVHSCDGWLFTTYYENSYRNIAVCDGSVLWLSQLRDPAVAKELTSIRTRRPGFNYHWDEARFAKGELIRTEVKWGKVWALSLFVILSLLPAAWVARRNTKIDSAGEQGEGDADEQVVVATDDAKTNTGASAAT